jgi:hypothetical protein
MPNFFWRRSAGNGSSSEFLICALRVDPTRAFPDVNDNLASRLSLRRKRLQQKMAGAADCAYRARPVGAAHRRAARRKVI